MSTESQAAKLNNDSLDLRALIETIPALVICVLADGTAEFANRAWQEYTGFALEELHGSGWRLSIHPEDANRVFDPSTAAGHSGRSGETEARLRCAAGGYRWFSVRRAVAVSRSQNGAHSLCTLIACEDIHDRKHSQDELRDSEEKYRLVVETATDAVICVNENGLIQFANSATFSLFGYRPDELLGRPLTTLMPPSVRARHASGFARYLATGEKRLNWQSYEMRGLRSNGEEFPAEVSIGETDQKGQRVFTGFIRDISDKKRAEEERERLRRAQADLAHINRVSTMGQLTASLAHEIKQPIAAAVTNARACMRWLQREEPDLEEAREAISRFIRDVTRASEIVNRVGALFRRHDLRREPVDVNALIREMIELLDGEATRYSVFIRAELAEGLPEVIADRVGLQQVLMNLMVNGFEAMQGMNGGELVIRTCRNQEGRLAVSVADTGVGLQPEQAQRIFDAFYTTKREGTGMGLAVSRSIVESHGGHLCAVAHSGPGSTFQLTLPVDAGAP
ncbi:MAG TPA: PAS domain S-box protein [Acidobacteriaceae bacterium]|nr:PAS domain S-box protein [Acidobacteriaceae bacterium]